MRHAPRVYLSALDGKGVHRLFPAMRAVHGAYCRKSTTTELNKVMRRAWDERPPPMAGSKGPKLYYCSQVHRAPPKFVLFSNLMRPPHFSYIRYLENVLREAFGLDGVPIRVMIRGRKS
jgi:GTP-binding protein